MCRVGYVPSLQCAELFSVENITIGDNSHEISNPIFWSKGDIRAGLAKQPRQYKNKSQRGLPLETKNTQNHENRRLGLIESLHIEHYSL